jgi:hypothetical protein
MDRPITPSNLGVGDRGQAQIASYGWLVMHLYQPEKECIDAMLARSPNLHFFFLSFLFYLRFFFRLQVTCVRAANDDRS